MTVSQNPDDETRTRSLFASLHLPVRKAVIAIGVATAGVGSAYILAPDTLAQSALLALALSWATFVDIERQILPDPITLGLVLSGLALPLPGPAADLLARSVGAMLGYGALFLVAFVFKRFRGREGLGLGDAKLVAAAGAWLGWGLLPFVLLISAALGLLYALTSSLIGRQPINRRIAFGPFIAAAFWGCWLATHVEAAASHFAS